MMMSLTLLQVFLACGLAVANAGITTKDTSEVSPPVDKSDKKFFGKDYPWDKRPKVDVLHFKHPYPVVQDSADFDADFVKDENSDNGSWKAQTEYDRLRHKLAKEKADVAKALAAKTTAENELRDAMKREKEQVDKKEKKKKEEEEKKRGAVSGSTGESEEKDEKVSGKKFSIPEKTRNPGGATAPGDTKVAVGDTQRAMDALNKCKEELAQARKKLKDLMEELEKAKAQQEKTQAALDAATERLKHLEAGKAAVDAAAEKEHQEYLDAKADYEKQQAKVAKMEADIKVAAAKVKAFRDSADKDGGVYPTPRNAASQYSVASALAVLAVSSLLIH